MRQRDMQHHTYADYLIWSADHGNEVIDGVAYVRDPPSPSTLHQQLVLELGHQLITPLAGKAAHVYIAPLDVRLPKHGSADDQIDTVVQRDVFIVGDPQKLDESIPPIGRSRSSDRKRSLRATRRSQSGRPNRHRGRSWREHRLGSPPRLTVMRA